MIQIVAYGGDAEEVLSTVRVGDGSAARRALGRINVGGGTNIEAGLRIAYRAAVSTRRSPTERPVGILLSDGVPNAGAFDVEELGPLAAEAHLALIHISGPSRPH